MNNKASNEFGFRRIYRMMQTSEGVITPSLICIILHILVSLIRSWYRPSSYILHRPLSIIPESSLMTLISFFNSRNLFSWYRGPIAVNEEARISATFTSNRGKDHTIAVSFVSDELNGVRGECTVLNVN